MKQASLFFRAVTVVDHATIDHRGKVIGGSFFPDVILRGKVDEYEQVVIDFSKGKALLKKAFDEIYDHKLWIVDRASNVNLIAEEKDSYVLIKTPAFEYRCHRRRICFFNMNEVNAIIERYLHENGCPGVEVEVIWTTRAFSETGSMFRYSHGLKNSSSFGCRNMGHGHLSFLELSSTTEEAKRLQLQIAQDLNEAVFVFDENIVGVDDDTLGISYVVEGETFDACYNRHQNKIFILPVETTAENLVDWVIKKYQAQLVHAGVKTVFLSEGLQKGAVGYVK